MSHNVYFATVLNRIMLTRHQKMSCPALGIALLAMMGSATSAAWAMESTPGYPAVQRAFLQEDFQQVTELAQTFILEHPNVPEVPRVWLWLALSLDRLQQSHEALREIDRLKLRLYTSDPIWPEVLFWEGDISRRAFQMRQAKSAYERLLDRYPDSTWAAQAQLGLGLVDLHEQEFATAVGYFHDAANRQEGTAVARDAALFEGLCQLELKRFNEAVAVFERLLVQLQDPRVIAQAAFYLGESLSGLGRYDEAVGAYQRAIDPSTRAPVPAAGSSLGVVPSERPSTLLGTLVLSSSKDERSEPGGAASATSQWNLPAQFGLAWAHFRAGRCEDSVGAFDRYLAKAVDHRTEALFAQGSCLMQLGQERDALAHFEQIVTRDPDHPLGLESALVIVDAYRRQGRLLLAKELLHAFLRRPLGDAAKAQIHLRLGAIALEQGNAAQARTIFTLAVQRQEPAIRQAALSGLGDVQMFLGNLTQAKASYEEALAASGEGPLASYASYQLGRIQLQLGAFEEAIRIFQRLQASQNAALADDARLALVIAYLNAHEEGMARQLIEAIDRERPGSVLAARVAYYQALLALSAADEGTARRLCEEVVANSPGTDEALEALLLLADLRSRESSPREAMAWLQQATVVERLPRAQRAKLIKRLGDFARAEYAYPEAIRWYEQAAQLMPARSGEIAYRVASCYEEADDFEVAIRWYEEIEDPAWRVRGQLAAAKLLERQGRMDEAKAIYEHLAQEPIPEAKVVQERLSAWR